jgi:hypothetical protein
MMERARCKTCGDPIKWIDRITKTDLPSGRWKKGERIQTWGHSDAMKRDHEAIPHDDRSGIEQGIRDVAAMDQAKMFVKAHIQRSFDYLNAEQRVDDLFHDRRVQPGTDVGEAWKNQS